MNENIAFYFSCFFFYGDLVKNVEQDSTFDFAIVFPNLKMQRNEF